MVVSVAHLCLASLAGSGVFRLSCSLLISAVGIPVLPRPSCLRILFRNPLSCTRPVPITHKEPRLVWVVPWFWPPEVRTSPTCYIGYIHSYQSLLFFWGFVARELWILTSLYCRYYFQISSVFHAKGPGKVFSGFYLVPNLVPFPITVCLNWIQYLGVLI